MVTKYKLAALLLCSSLLAGLEPPSALAGGGCGDPNNDDTVNATDALLTLKTAVSLQSCDLARCDVNDDGSINATDALMVLKRAVSLIGEGGLDCPGIQVTSIGDLPHATAPVTGSASASTASLLHRLFDQAGGVSPRALELGDIDENAYDATDSIALCETANRVKDAVSSAAQADLILCYIQGTFEANQEVGINIYDGAFHTFNLYFDPAGLPPGDDGQGPSRVRFKIVSDADGTVTDFIMYSCGDGGAGDEVQNEYLAQSIDGTDFSMTAKGMWTDGESSGWHSAVVSGDLNDDGEFVDRKTIVIKSTGADSYGGNTFTWNARETFVQGADSIQVSGSEIGTYSDGASGNHGTHSNRLVARASFEDANSEDSDYDLSLLAIGHGAARAGMDGTWSYDTPAAPGCPEWAAETGQDSGAGTVECTENWNFTASEGWNGDDASIDNDTVAGVAAGHIAQVLSDTLPEAISSVSISFDGAAGEVYDCSDTADATVTVNMIDLGQSCGNLQLDYDWVNCHEIMGDQHEDCDQDCEEFSE